MNQTTHLRVPMALGQKLRAIANARHVTMTDLLAQLAHAPAIEHGLTPYGERLVNIVAERSKRSRTLNVDLGVGERVTGLPSAWAAFAASVERLCDGGPAYVDGDLGWITVQRQGAGVVFSTLAGEKRSLPVGLARKLAATIKEAAA